MFSMKYSWLGQKSILEETFSKQWVGDNTSSWCFVSRFPLLTTNNLENKVKINKKLSYSFCWRQFFHTILKWHEAPCCLFTHVTWQSNRVAAYVH